MSPLEEAYNAGLTQGRKEAIMQVITTLQQELKLMKEKQMEKLNKVNNNYFETKEDE